MLLLTLNEGKCVPHIVNAAWATWVLASLPSGSKTISSKMGKLNIVSLPLIPKMCAVIFIQLPLVFLDVALAIVGMKFLMYCNALGKLIVKAMSLSYIETVAGVVFVTLTHELSSWWFLIFVAVPFWAGMNGPKWLSSVFWVDWNPHPVFEATNRIRDCRGLWPWNGMISSCSSSMFPFQAFQVTLRLACHPKHSSWKSTKLFWFTSSRRCLFISWSPGCLEASVSECRNFFLVS